MRPLRLDVEGFTCYRERQEPLDFSGLSLFAIAGPTGAGKSSILDAMLYALYGEVPRMGKRDLGEFISHGRDAMAVMLDFRVNDRDYRIVRRAKRLRSGALKTDAILAEVTGGLERSLADAVKPVNDAVGRLLGLGYDEFTQTVVLPQGEFARFLKAKPGEQRSILQHLLRHDIYARMQGLAESRRKSVEAELRVVDGKLSTYADATPDALIACEGALEDARARLAEATASRDEAEAALKDVQQRYLLTRQIEKLRADRQALDRETGAVEGARVELVLAGKAAPLVPRLEAVEAARRRVVSQSDARDRAARAFETARTAHDRDAEQLARARDAAAECDALDERVRALDRIAGAIRQRAELATTLAEMPRRLADAEKASEAARSAEASARRVLAKAEKALRSLEATHDAVTLDEAAAARVEQAYARVAEGRALARDVAAARQDVTASAAAVVKAEAEHAAASIALERASVLATETARQAEAARHALEDARRRHAAADLRAHLHAGDDCPVCLRAMDAVPAVEAPPELEALSGAARQADEQARQAETRRQTASTTLAQANERLSSVRDAADGTASRLAGREQQLSTLLAALSALVAAVPLPVSPGVGELSSHPCGEATPEAVFDAVEHQHLALRAARDERARLATARQEAAAAVADARLKTAQAEAAAAAATARVEQCAAEQDQLRARLDAVTAEIRAVTTHPDPDQERASLAARAVALREAEKDAAAALARTQSDLATATAGRGAAEAATADAEAAFAQASAALASALAEAGLATADAVRSALRTPAQQAALQQRVAAHDQQRALVSQQLADIEPRLAGREASADDLAAAVARHGAAQDAWQAATRSVTTQEHEAASVRKRLAARDALVAERATRQSDLDLTFELATDLRGDRFQQYLLDEAFTALVAGASVRMREMSNRYTLEWAEGEFLVVDHDNAGERRRADTLSGGETFMASLCLALQLGETVLQASGGLQMDGLFIDEGFGTLDADSLGEVTDAIERLGRDGQRLVGVISHREELTDRLPGLVRVEKGAGESRWRMERTG